MERKADREARQQAMLDKSVEGISAHELSKLQADAAKATERGVKEQLAERAARARESYAARMAALEEDIMNEFGLSRDELKQLGIKKADQVDLLIPSKDKDVSAHNQASAKNISVRTDGELPETTVEEVNALGGDLPEDIPLKEEEGVPEEYAANDETIMPFADLKGKPRIKGYQLFLQGRAPNGEAQNPWGIFNIDDKKYEFWGDHRDTPLPEELDLHALIDDLRDTDPRMYNELYYVTDGDRKHKPFNSQQRDNDIAEQLGYGFNTDNHIDDYIDGPDSLYTRLKNAADDGLLWSDFDEDLWNKMPAKTKRMFGDSPKGRKGDSNNARYFSDMYKNLPYELVEKALDTYNARNSSMNNVLGAISGRRFM